MSEKELKPCPFCGQQEAFVEQLDSDASVVICQGMVDEHSACLARGPVGVQQSDMEDQPGRDAAIAEWNRRAQPAETDGFQIARHSKRLVEKLRAEVEALRKDAERYRWIERHADVDMRGHCPGDENDYGELSDMIDAAMAAKDGDS